MSLFNKRGNLDLLLLLPTIPHRCNLDVWALA